VPRWLKRLRAALRLRARRQYLILRGMRRLQRHVRPVADRSAAIRPGDLLVFVTLRNERVRLPWFLDYYRRLGVNHFLVVDNDSDDGSAAYLAQQPDVSLWTTTASYKAARFGMDWINGLLRRHGSGHWWLLLLLLVLSLLVRRFVRPLRALTDWLDASAIKSFSAMLIDVYPRGDIAGQPYAEGTDPLAIAAWFDPANYTIQKNSEYGNLWIQGGPRARAFFADNPWKAPALNKIPLVRWERHFAYVSSTHMLLPRSLNLVYDEDGGEKASGCLLHAKFLGDFAEKAAVEMTRQQHYADSVEYRAYDGSRTAPADLWCRWSEKYESWRQLERLGLMSSGNWA